MGRSAGRAGAAHPGRARPPGPVRLGWTLLLAGLALSCDGGEVRPPGDGAPSFPPEPGRPAAPGAVTPAAAEPPLPPGVRSWLEKVRAVEAAALATGESRAERPSWDRLEIELGDGAGRVFADEVDGSGLRRVHVLHGFLEPLSAWLVEVVLVPEGGAFLLLDGRDGGVTEVDGPPSVSPDGRRFVTTSVDLVSGHRPNRVRIYRMEAAGPVLEWEAEPRGWGAADPVWLDAATLALDREELDTSTRPFSTRRTPWSLELRDGSWQGLPPD